MQTMEPSTKQPTICFGMMDPVDGGDADSTTPVVADSTTPVVADSTTPVVANLDELAW
jgi:hypothetical protein